MASSECQGDVNTLVFLDLEATGLAGPGSEPRITEISMVAVSATSLHENQKQPQSLPRVIDKLSLCVYPMKQIGSFASTITGLYNDNLFQQKDFDQDTARMVVLFLQRLAPPVCIMAHNGKAYDFGLLKTEMARTNVELPLSLCCVDTLELFRNLDGMIVLVKFQHALGSGAQNDSKNAIADSPISKQANQGDSNASKQTNSGSAEKEKLEESRNANTVCIASGENSEITTTSEAMNGSNINALTMQDGQSKTSLCSSTESARVVTLPDSRLGNLEMCQQAQIMNNITPEAKANYAQGDPPPPPKIGLQGKRKSNDVTPSKDEGFENATTSAKRKLFGDDVPQKSSATEAESSETVLYSLENDASNLGDFWEELDDNSVDDGDLVSLAKQMSQANKMAAKEKAEGPSTTGEHPKLRHFQQINADTTVVESKNPTESAQIDTENVTNTSAAKSGNVQVTEDENQKIVETSSTIVGENISSSSDASASTSSTATVTATSTPTPSTATVTATSTPTPSTATVTATSTPTPSTVTVTATSTPTPSTLTVTTTSTPMPPVGDKQIFTPPRLSYKLAEIHSRLLGKYPAVSHSAEDDCIAMLKICQARATQVLDWVNKKSVPLSNVPNLYTPRSPAKTLPTGMFPCQLKK